MDKLPIAPRQEGETEEDYQRRYCREKMRIYRARRPKSDRKRGRNNGPGKHGTLTQAEWERLQPQPGESAEDHARRYAREMVARYRRSKPERAAAARRAYEEANRDHLREKAKELRQAFPERQPEYARRYREKHPEKAAERRAGLKAWRQNNPDRLAEAKARWNEANRGLLASYSAKWRESCRIAMPAWADFDQIRAFYEEAARLTTETGIPHEVDHIVPLRGRTVCGLHVQTNLRVIPGVDNAKKHNRLDEALALA